MTKSVLTLEESKPQDLVGVQAQRRQLRIVLLVVAVLTASAVVLFSIASEQLLRRPLGFLDLGMLRWAFLGLVLLFAVYFAARERALLRSERALMEERILSAALSSRLHELAALSRAGKAMITVLSNEDLLSVLLDSTRELLGATEASVMLHDPQRRTLRVAGSFGIDEEAARATEIPLGQGVAGWVAESLEPVVLRGPLDDPRFRGFVPKSRQVRSAMSAPLRVGGELVGVLNVSVSDGEREFGPHDLRALTVFAEHAAIALSNAHLYEQEKTSLERLARLNQQRQDFLATMTHDLKTPLTSILGFVQLLRRGGENLGTEQLHSFIEVIERQGQRILEMVEQMVEVNKLEEGTPTMAREPLDVGAIIQGQAAAFEPIVGDRTLEMAIQEDLPTPYGDASAIEHILANLLENAVRYTKQDGTIRVAAEAVSGEVHISVTDDGPGIPEEDLSKIFERYHQGEGGERGTAGLGLYIVRNLTQAHGGRAWAENVNGRGARMVFSLPVRSR